MRLIDGDELLAQMAGMADGWFDPKPAYDYESLVKQQPTVDAVPVKHGRWQWLSSTYDRIPCEVRYRCDKCHHETITHGYVPWEKYCPNCGAKMDLEEQDAADRH